MANSKKPSSSRTRTVRQPERKGKRRFRINRDHLRGVIVRVALLALVIVLIVIIVSNQTAMSCVNISQCARNTPSVLGSGNGFPVMINGSRILQTEPIAKNIAVLSDTTFQVFNRSSKQVASRTHFLSRPVMKTNGYYAVLIDIGDTGFRLEGISETILAGDYDQDLISCAISESSTFALVSQGSSHNSAMLSSVDVIDSSGNSLHKWHTSDYYINDAALNSNAKKLAMCGITANEGYMHSVIIVHKVGSDQPLARIDCPNIMLYSVSFNDNDSLVAVGDNGIYIIEDNYQVYKYYEFSGKLLAFDIDKYYGAALFTSELSGSESGMLTVYDINGEERFSKNINMTCSALSLNSSGCCLLGNGELMCYRLNGGFIGRWHTETTPSDVVMILRGAYLSDGISIRYQELSAKNNEE